VSAVTTASRVRRADPGNRSRPGTSADRRPGILWALPAFAFFTLFAVVPMVLVLVLSFTDWRGIGTPTSNGLANWERLAKDQEALDALARTGLVIVAGWALQTPMALLIGVWAAGRQRFRAILSAIFFVPLLLSTAAIALSWQAFLDVNFGLPNAVDFLLGDNTNLIGDPHRAIWVVVFVSSWQWVPFHTLLYQGAARGIPAVLYEAAAIDGATGIRKFWSITLPQLRYTIVTSTILMLVGGVTTFDLILILTGGGPGQSTLVLPLDMYQKGFLSFDMGYASAIAVVIVVLGTLMSLAVVRLTGFRSMSSQSEGL
jgi:xylobiose transport system permease protein